MAIDTLEENLKQIPETIVPEAAAQYRFIKVNPALEREAGVNLRGRWVIEYAPDLEQFWFDTHGGVAKTLKPATFENYAEALER